jgi:hypothetical protein
MHGTMDGAPLRIWTLQKRQHAIDLERYGRKAKFLMMTFACRSNIYLIFSAVTS